MPSPRAASATGTTIIGIDPGTRHLGWGVIQACGNRLMHRAHGVIDTNESHPLAYRLCEIDDVLEQVIEAYRPQQAAVEALFFARDPQAASKLGHARGVALLRLARAQVTIYEYPPARIKRAIAGNGRADKRQVGLMVKSLLGMREELRADASDALAVAITHAQVARFDAALRAGQLPVTRPASS